MVPTYDKILPITFYFCVAFFLLYEVSANAILTPEEISNIVKDYENTDLSATEIKELMGRIDELCVDKGYITSFAYLSQQNSKNGLLKIAIKEGKVGKINIKGNRWTKVSHIKSRLDITEGENFNTNDVLFSGGAGLRVQLPFNIVLKATYGVPLKHNKFDKHHGNWNLELCFSPDFNKFFNR